ncbi:MAG: hypothetical protein JST92_25280 [Deltaproteobacteria bacterium]|nr:hypothetical protein [Deltaproteobacteria bacterium]
MRPRLAAALAAVFLGLAPVTLAAVVRCPPVAAERVQMEQVRAHEAAALVLESDALLLFGAARHVEPQQLAVEFHAVRPLWHSPSGPAPSQAPPQA